VFFSVCTVACAEPPTGEAPNADQPLRDPASIRAERRQTAVNLASRLGNPRYEVREEATRKLEQLGIDAIEPLLAAAAGENLEVISRAVRALTMIYDSEDNATFDAAEVALEQLAESSNRPAAQRAAVALAPQDALWTPETDPRRLRRWKRAIVRIRELGGVIKRIDPNGMDKDALEASPEEYPSLMVILDETWKGGGTGIVNVKRLAVRMPLPLVYVIKGANVPGEAIASVQRAIPPLRVEFRGSALLGIRCEARGPCRVDLVEPNSAAHRAGIQPGDVILKYDGETLSSFERLIEITSDHKPGDKVELEVRRGETTLTIEARLTGWSLPGPTAGKK
jgi:hypothetical protein